MVCLFGQTTFRYLTYFMPDIFIFHFPAPECLKFLFIFSVRHLLPHLLHSCLHCIRPSITGLSYSFYSVFCSLAFNVPTGAKLVRRIYSLVLQKLFCFCEDRISLHSAQYCHSYAGKVSAGKVLSLPATW